MKKGKWFFEGQRLFKQWKKESNLTGDCTSQTITPYSLEEKWLLRNTTTNDGHNTYVLSAFKNTPLVYVTCSNGERIELQKDSTLIQ